MGNLWPYKNHHFRSKYHLVLLQESCEIIQFKSGHPVCQHGWFSICFCILLIAVMTGFSRTKNTFPTNLMIAEALTTQCWFYNEWPLATQLVITTLHFITMHTGRKTIMYT